MPKKIFCFLVIGLWLLAIGLKPVHAEDDPTPSASPPTCDSCGWCNSDPANPDPETNPKPPNWDQCNKCLYKADGTPRERTYYTVIGCISTESNLFVKSLLTIVFAAAGGIAFLSVLAGSATVLTSSGDPERIQSGKDTITSALFGMLLIIFSVFLLRVVGLDILHIPGFG